MRDLCNKLHITRRFREMGCCWIRRDLGLHAAQVNVRLAPVADQIRPIFGTSARTLVGEYSRVGFVKEVREGPRCLGSRLKIYGKMPLRGPYNPTQTPSR